VQQSPDFSRAGIADEKMATNPSQIDSEVQCPKCDEGFSSERGMKIHHKRVHGKSISGKSVKCDRCGSEFSKIPILVEKHDHHFCSKSCRIEWKSHSEKELIDELARLRNELGRTPSQSHLKNHSDFNKKAYKRAFGGWNNALREAGMQPNRENHTNKDCLDDILAVARKLGEPPGITEHREHGSISPQCIRSKFGSWARAISKSGLDSTKVREYGISDNQLLTEIESVAERIDAVPTMEDMNTVGEYAAVTVQKRFGTWRDALLQAGFEPNRKPTVTVECSNCGDETEKIQQHVERAENNFCSESCHYDWLRENAPAGSDHHQYKPNVERRDYGPSWPAQRRKARKRDQFTCQRCGMSDSDHIDTYGCELHVHHITPWDEFEDHEERNSLSNLVTLCASCHVKIENLPVKPVIHTQ